MSDTTMTSETPAAELGKTITVTVYFRLSGEGQKAAVLRGKPAAKDQEITGQVAAELLPLCEIQADGSVIAKFRDQIDIGERGEISHGRSWAAYFPYLDAPPDSAEAILLHVREGLAQKISEVKAKWAERQAEMEDIKRKRQGEFEASMAKAGASLEADPTAIPNVHMPIGYVYQSWYDSNHPVAVEIRRRKAAAEAAEKRAAAEAAESKRQFIRAFLVEHGTPDQVERFDAGLLPEKEYTEAMADLAFGPLKDLPRYQKLTRADAWAALDEDQQALVNEGSLDEQFNAEDATEATPEEWAALKRIQSLMPEAECKLRLHDSTFDHKDIPWGLATRKGIQVKVKYGPFSFVREYGVL